MAPPVGRRARGLLPVCLVLAGAAAAEAPEVGAAAAAVSARMGVVAGYDDNLGLRPEAVTASHFLAWAPSLTVALPRDEDQYTVTLRGELTRYSAGRRHDTDNLEASVDGLMRVDPSSAAAWRLTLQDWNDPAGGNTLGGEESGPDHFRAQALGVVWRRQATADGPRREAELALSHKAYVNHRETTVAGDLRTRSATLRQLGGGVSDLRWLWEARLVDADYAYAAQALDNRDLRLFTGLVWDPGEDPDPDFSGALRLGLQRKRFDRIRPGYGAAAWELQGRWRVAPGSSVEASASRAAIDAPGDGANQVVSTQAQLGGTMALGPALAASLSLSRASGRFQYLDPGERRDRTTSVDLGLRVAMDASARISLSHSLLKRRSNQPGLDFRRRLATVAFELDL